MTNRPIDILILEDDTLFAETLEDLLEEAGYRVEIAGSGESALDKCYEKEFDLLLLDINVPGPSGLEVLERIRAQQDNTPAIFLTSFKDGAHLRQGFEKGADDYLKKPIDPDELLLRIKALLKRSHRWDESIPIHGCRYIPATKTLVCEERHHTLSNKLARLLDLFLSHANEIVTREMIMRRLWEWDEEPSLGAIRVYVNDLKKLIGKEHIENIKGVGYKLSL